MPLLLLLAACGDPATVLTATTSYGECLGECVFELIFDAGTVELDIRDHDGTPYNHNAGTLTAAGAERLAVVETGLGRARLEATYGCPGCDDGPARDMTLLQGGVEAATRWEAGDAPNPLIRADALITDLDAALRQCITIPDLAIEPGCVREGE